MAKYLFGDIVREIKEKVDRDNNPYDYFIAGDHMDTDELHLLRRGLFEGSDVGPAFIRVFKPGQVLYGSRRTYLRKVAVADFEGVTANTTFVLESKDESILLQSLLPFIMQSDRFVQHSIKRSKGSTNPYVLFSDLADYEVDLPDIHEQKRLSEVSWAIDSVKMSYKRLISATDDLVKSQFIEMFGMIDATSLCNMAKVSAGQSSPYDEEFSATGTPFIKAGDLESLKKRVISENDCNLVDNETIIRRKLKLHGKGTVLVAKSGMSCLSGHVYALKEPAYIVSHLACIEPIEGKSTTEYLRWLFITCGIKDLIKDPSYPSIQLSQLNELQIPNASYSKQLEFSSFASQSDKSKLLLGKTLDFSS